MVLLDEIKRAKAVTAGACHRTPLFSAASLGRLTGTRLYFKAECLQKTGSFKVRGADNKIRSLPRGETRGVITLSSGNHGQATAYIAGILNVPATILVPDLTPQSKIDAARAYGAEVLVGGDLNNVEALRERVLELSRERNLSIIHPFDDPLIIAGQGTIALEILEDLPDVEVVVVPVGGGGLIAGVAAALKQHNPAIKVYGVGPEGASSMARSFRENEPVSLKDMPATVADGIRTPVCGQITLPLAQKYVEDVVTVSDEEITMALGLIWQRSKLLAEPAGAAPFAAIYARRLKLPVDTRAVCILSGGNVDLNKVGSLLSRCSHKP